MRQGQYLLYACLLIWAVSACGQNHKRSLPAAVEKTASERKAVGVPCEWTDTLGPQSPFSVALVLGLFQRMSGNHGCEADSSVTDRPAGLPSEAMKRMGFEPFALLRDQEMNSEIWGRGTLFDKRTLEQKPVTGEAVAITVVYGLDNTMDVVFYSKNQESLLRRELQALHYRQHDAYSDAGDGGKAVYFVPHDWVKGKCGIGVYLTQYEDRTVLSLSYSELYQ